MREICEYVTICHFDMLFQRPLDEKLSASHARLPDAAIIDTSNDTLVALGSHVSAMILLSEMMLDTVHLADLPPTPELEQIAKVPPSQYPEWTYIHSRRSFSRTHPELISQELRDRSVLAAGKRDAIIIGLRHVNGARVRMSKSLLFQETIFAAKEQQARRLKEAQYDPALVSEVPYVSQYAEIKGVSLKEAADEILLRAQFFHEFLLKTERARLVLFQKIRNASTVEEVTSILNNYKNNRVL